MKEFIQPYIEGEDLRIYVTRKDGKTKVEVRKSSDCTKYSLKSRFIKELKECYENSKYYNFNVVLFARYSYEEAESREHLVFYDIMLKEQYDAHFMNIKYSVRYENLALRFFRNNTKICSVIFSFDSSDELKLDLFIRNHFMTKLDIDSVIFRKDSSYTGDDDIRIVKVTDVEAFDVVGVVVDTMKVQTPDSTEDDPKTEDKEFASQLVCASPDGKTLLVSTSAMQLKDKMSLATDIEKMDNVKCRCLHYNLAGKEGRTFIEFI